MQVTPLHPILGAEIIGLDLAQQDRIPFDEVRRAMDRHAVCVVRNKVPPTDEQHCAFSRELGPIEIGPIFKVKGDGPKRVKFPELMVDVSNLNLDGTIMAPTARRAIFKKGDKLWHNDMSFMQNRATYSLLCGHEIPPEGGNTEFCDLRAAYDALSDEMKERLENLVAFHSIWNSRRVAGFPEPTQEEIDSCPPSFHRLVQVHPTSKRKTLYIAAHASHILGWPVDEGRALLKQLMRHASQAQFVYSHKWQLGDLLIWDNRCTMHRATDFDDQKYRRDMRRTTCRERPIAQFAAETFAAY
jgi:alpha-ketoglutarate-dependent 2,4-dichlorophenoxyacetate dioxygenase